VQPTITDWLQGLGTAMGMIFAAVAAFVAIMLFRHELEVRRHDEADKEAAQARHRVMGTYAMSCEEALTCGDTARLDAVERR
jgi:hypothetical protein